jgi:hypothetical protein
MMPRVILLTVVTLALSAASAFPQQDRRFSYERSAQADGTGPRRLAVDLTLLSGGAPFRVTRRGDRLVADGGLRDFRLFDTSGSPLPYLLIHRRDEEVWRTGRILPVASTKTTSGFEVDFGGSPSIDRVRISGITAPFLKRLILEGSGDRSRWTLLEGEATLFDLPDEHIRNTDLDFRAGEYRYLRVTWNDANSGRVALPRVVSAREAAHQPGPLPLAGTLVFERRPSEPGRSRYRISLPAAQLPIVALDLDVAPGHVFRSVSVSESRFTGVEAAPVVLGSGMLVRVLRAGAAAESLRVTIAPPAEAEIDLTVEDGNNPPLDLRKVSAVFAELPWIYLQASSPTIVARYGDRTASAPTYDLEAARASIDLSRTREARWDAARPLVGATATDRPASAVSAGAALEGNFRYTRTIAGVDRAGLAAVPLDASVLSHSLGPSYRFADVRIADSTNRQVPYLLERRDEPLAIDLALAPAQASQMPLLAPTQGGSRSVYRVVLPQRRLPAGSLSVETSARVFQRAVQVGVVRPADRNRRDAWFDALAATTWRHTDEQTATPALALRVSPGDASELWLVIDEGDNAPLPLDHPRLLLPSYRLRFFTPAAGGLRLVYGREDLQPPRYDLSLLAPTLMGAAATEVAAGPESARTERGAFISPRWFWVLLSVSVLVLLGLIVRLARRA